MTYFKDLNPCSYFGKWSETLSAIGWLDMGNDFAKGAVSDENFMALVRLCADPWQPVAVAGRHRCPFCRFTGGPAEFIYRGVDVALGASNVFVPCGDRVFVAPTMIVHYIDAHEYAPPSEFQEAVMRCPEMRSFAYLKEMKLRRILVSR